MALESLHNFSRYRHDKYEHPNVDLDIGNLVNQHQLLVPKFPKEDSSVADYLVDEHGRQLKLHFKRGTTTMAFKFQGGIIVAADSRASSGTYIGSGTVQKIIEINSDLLGTMAGGAADCSYWERVLAKQCRIYELRNREKISVAAASKLLANMVYQYKGYGLCMGVMISGYDKKGPSIYYVDDSGQRLGGNMFSVGSGSIYAYGVWNSGYRWDMTDEEAQELARSAIYHATYTDPASGGIVRVYHIKKDKWEKITEEDCKDLHYRYEAQKMSTS